MAFIDFISIAIMTPAMFGLIFLYFLFSGLLYLLFRKLTAKEYKKMLKDIRFSDDFINKSRNIFWFTYTPLFAVVVIFRIVIPIDSEKYYGCMTLSIVGYLLILLFSGYVFPKESKAEMNYKKICHELDLITSAYEKIHPDNYLGRYYHHIRNFTNEYGKSSKQIYKEYDENTDFTRIAHILLLKIIYDLIISQKIKWDEHSTKCACNLFAYVAKLSIKNKYVGEQTVSKYVTEIKKAINTRKDD